MQVKVQIVLVPDCMTHSAAGDEQPESTLASLQTQILAALNAGWELRHVQALDSQRVLFVATKS